MQIKISQNEAGQRFDRFLRKYFKNSPEIKLTEIYSWIRKGFIRVNGFKKPENYKLQLNDNIELKENFFDKKNPMDCLVHKDQKKININIEELKKQILYEDDNWIFWDKPVGIVMHEGNKHSNDLTMNDYLEQYVLQTGDKNISQTFRPSFGFRLDKDTTGIVVGAKNYDALKYLNEIIKSRKTKKTYLAIVSGKTPESLDINEKLSYGYSYELEKSITYVDNENGLTSHTRTKLLKHIKDEFLGDISFLEIELLTGRMHQIRVHLAYRGFPIIGDIMYGSKGINNTAKKYYKTTRQLLHSFRYCFFDKFQYNDICIQSKIHDDFKKIIGDYA